MLRNSLNIAYRTFRRYSLHNAISIIGLAVGMVSCMFLAVYIIDEVSYDRYHTHADLVFRVATDVKTNQTTDHSAYSFSALGPSLVDNLPTVEAATRIGMSWAASSVRAGEKYFDKERILVADSTFFSLFTYRFISGTPGSALNRPYTVVLTASAAKRYFGDENPIGRTISRENSQDLEVTAIVEDSPTNTHIKFDALASFESLNAQRRLFFENNWRILYGYTYIKLSDEADAEGLAQRFSTLFASHLQPTQERWGASFGFQLQPLASIHLHSDRDNELEPGGSVLLLYLLSVIAGLLMLIACINFVSLSTAQGAERAREVGVRKVLGASRYQLVRQFLTESTLIALLAAMLSLGLFVLLLPVFNELSGKAFELGMVLSFYVPVGFISVACLTGVVGGVYAAFVISARRPLSALKGGRGHGDASVYLRKCLIGVQFAAVGVLMIGTLVVHQQLNYMKSAELGFEKDQVIVLGEIFASSPVNRWEEMKSIKQELLRNTLVEGVTLSSEWPTRPVQGQISIQAEGSSGEEGTPIAWYQVEEDYLELMGIELLHGRNFVPGRASDSAAVLINQEAAKRLGLNEEDAVGSQLLEPGNNKEIATIIGVVKDFHTQSLHYAVEPISFFSYWARPRNILVKISGEDVPGALAQIEETWARMMPDKPLRYDFLDQEYAALYQSEVRLSRLAGVFTGIAILIACMGLWSLASYFASLRTKEIGIRKVLGATISSVVVLLTKDFIRLVGLSFLVSAPVAYIMMNRWLEGYAYRIELSPWTLVLVGGSILGLTILTVSYQSIKASLNDPIKSIRYE